MLLIAKIHTQLRRIEFRRFNYQILRVHDYQLVSSVFNEMSSMETINISLACVCVCWRANGSNVRNDTPRSVFNRVAVCYCNLHGLMVFNLW